MCPELKLEREALTDVLRSHVKYGSNLTSRPLMQVTCTFSKETTYSATHFSIDSSKVK